MTPRRIPPKRRRGTFDIDREAKAKAAREARRKPQPPCIHLGEPTGEQATVVCLTCKKERKERLYAIHGCAIHGETLKDFQCIRDSKDALAEWMEKQGRETVIAVCRGCPDFSPSPAGESP